MLLGEGDKTKQADSNPIILRTGGKKKTEAWSGPFRPDRLEILEGSKKVGDEVGAFQEQIDFRPSLKNWG